MARRVALLLKVVIPTWRLMVKAIPINYYRIWTVFLK